MRKLTAVLAAAAVMAAGCSSAGTKAPVRHRHPAATASTAAYTRSEARQACRRYASSPAPLTDYALLVIRKTVQIGGTNPTKADAAAARAAIAGEISTTCPQFNYLTDQYAAEPGGSG